MLEQTQKRKEQQGLALILVLGFLLRLFLAGATTGYHYDTSCFFAWGNRMVEFGTGGFYAEDYFCDYPPAYLYVLAFVSRMMSLFEVNYLEKSAQVLLVLVPALADVGLGFGLYRIAKKQQPQLALRLAAFVAFCPLFWYDTAVWKQIDSVLALLLVASFYLLGQKQWFVAAALYGLALAVKPQALILGPVLGIAFLLPVFFAKDIKAFWRAVANGVLGVLVAVVPLYLCAVPFYGVGNTLQGLYQAYTTTATSYPYASVNAFNFIAACGGNWVGDAQPFTIPLFGKSLELFFSWHTFGSIAIIAITVFVAYLAVVAQKRGCFSPALLAGVYMVAVFTFGHSMHERYLLLGVSLLLCAVAQFGCMRLLGMAGGFSLTALFNMAVVYTVVDTDDNFLTSATSTLTMRTIGALETILCIVLLYHAWHLCCKAAPVACLANSTHEKEYATKQQFGKVKSTAKQARRAAKRANLDKEAYQVAPQPAWCKKEKIFVIGLTLAVALLSFLYLGDITAPQNALDLRDGSSETVVVVPEGDTDMLWIYAGITNADAMLSVTDLDGMPILNVNLPIGDLFQWKQYSIPSCDGYIVSVSGAELIELGFKDVQGTLLPLIVTERTGADITASSPLFDEQALIPQTASQLNSFYFDEIYHARTAYESVNGMPIYEISHPPMGKNLIALGVMLFGMTGFGWRCVGALFGVLMVPVIYWLTRRLSRNAVVAGFVALLFSFDFMRYTQSRIATIDTISAFFILLGASCMVWYCQTVLEKGVRNAILPMALSGLAFGFGAASKWTGLYAGVALAILYFGVLGVRMYQQKQQNRFAKLHREWVPALVGGTLFFVFVPLVIYWFSYLPYYLADPSFGFAQWWQNQEYMYWYHSSLEATHPFSSSWYSWVLNLRPVWYYMGQGLPQGTYASIAGFYNPLLCWVGVAAWLRLCLRALQGKGTFVGNALIVLLLSQFLPWLLVTRCTFLYHYFPSFLFTLVAIGLWFQDVLQQNETRAYIAAVCLLVAVAVCFVWFYPVLSGLPVGTLWAQSLKIFPSYGFYIIS